MTRQTVAPCKSTVALIARKEIIFGNVDYRKVSSRPVIWRLDEMACECTARQLAHDKQGVEYRIVNLLAARGRFENVSLVQSSIFEWACDGQWR